MATHRTPLVDLATWTTWFGKKTFQAQDVTIPLQIMTKLIKMMGNYIRNVGTIQHAPKVILRNRKLRRHLTRWFRPCWHGGIFTRRKTTNNIRVITRRFGLPTIQTQGRTYDTNFLSAWPDCCDIILWWQELLGPRTMEYMFKIEVRWTRRRESKENQHLTHSFHTENHGSRSEQK